MYIVICEELRNTYNSFSIQQENSWGT